MASSPVKASIKTISRTKVVGGKAVTRRTILSFEHPMKEAALAAERAGNLTNIQTLKAALARPSFSPSVGGREI